ncbi:MAG: CoA-binding protein [Thermofilum sp. ex4484_82]|nr:MAG: CoA-binding protein [Thermofilum sp. ex4484_82]OYT39557.1 MAG: CoA-binding protein [Archaeoglobales archaeon ex4484_92]
MGDSNLKFFFRPAAVAIIGASREEEKPGHVILANFIENKRKGLFKGEVYAVNPFVDEVLGLKTYPSVLDIPVQIDLGVIVVPAKVVPKVMEDCGRKKVKGVIIISAGFSEIGNVELEKRVKEIAKHYSVRIIGPNCIGIYDAYGGIDTFFLPMHKTMKDGKKIVSTPRPGKGYISLMSQSGAFGTAALDYMSGENIGISSFVSYGNKADIDEADLLEYFAEDENTRAIMIYAESIDRGRKFIDVASKVSLRKPIIALKAGRTAAGSRAAASHTAAITGVDEIYEAAFKKAGIIRTYSTEEFFDAAKALAFQPPARNKRVGIITDGGGAGVMTTDALEILGMQVPEFTGKTKNKLKELVEDGVIPLFASIGNPVDLTGSATTEMYVKTFRILMDSDQIDIVIVLALHHIPGIADPLELVNAIADEAKKYDKPVIACDIGGSDMAVLVREEFDKKFIPAYSSPERSAHAARALAEYGSYLQKKGVFDDYMRKWKPIASS